MKIKLDKSLFTMLTCLCVAFSGYNQDATLNIKARVVNQDTNPIKGAKIVLGNGLVTSYTDENGNFIIEAEGDNILLISANGYQNKVFKLSDGPPDEEIVMEGGLLFDSEENKLRLPGNLTTTKRRTVSAISTIDAKEMESQPDMVFQNSLQGRLAGLTVRMNTSGLGNNVSDLFVRGLSRDGGNGAIILVDGIERPAEFLYPQEIESIEVLKDASSKILYGPRAANGVILITTKRGKYNTEVIRTSAEYGVNINTRMPDYLGSAQYARLYNEARANDGLLALYSQEDIAGYESSTGPNDLRYPDADYNDFFLEEVNPFRKANFLYSGGSEGARYAVVAGYIGAKGLEKIGEAVNLDRFNVRGNLDIDISDALKAHLGGNGIIESRNLGKRDQGAVFGGINSQRPNEFPFVITDPDFLGEDTPLGEERIPPLGGSFQNPSSLYGDMLYGGSQGYQFFYGQTNFGLDLDAGKFIKGLSISTDLTFDNYQFHSENQINDPIRYAIRVLQGSSGQDSLAYTQLNNRGVSDNISESGDAIERNFGWSSNIKYDVTYNKNNDISLNLGHFYFLNDDQSRQKVENTNTYLRTTYSHKNKIYLDWTQTVMGSNRFDKGNRFQYFASIGAAWILTEENFMADAEALDFLKIKSSYGRMGYDRSTSYYLYEERYSNGGGQSFGERNRGGAGRTSFSNFGNPNLEWETAQDFNVGIEGLAFNESLAFEMNYFNENRRDIIVDNVTSTFSDIGGGFNIPENVGHVFNQGVDGSITYKSAQGDLKYDVGANFLYVKNEIKKADVIDNPNEYLNPEGRPSDAIFGYIANGLFRDQAQVDAAPFQALGGYGIGSVRYQDLNGDGVINEQDRKQIGNNFPRVTLGLNLNLKYKNFGLSMLGTSELGVDFIKNNAFYRNAGEGKYSVLALDRFHPVNNPNGSQPALTTTNAVNDFQGSTFWLESGSFFRMKNVELSYTLSNDTWVTKLLRFYVRGTNLFVLSSEKDLDPEVPASGVNNYPVFRTITGGVTVGF